MGWQEKGTVDRTFRNRPAGLQRAKTLFGVDVQDDNLVIIVESPLDCLRIHSAGQVGALATCGTTLSEEQIKLIRRSDKVICAFDNPEVDKAGKKASDEMRKFARKYGINLFFFNYGGSNKKDPGEMTDEEILWGIANAKSSILGELAYVSGDIKALSG
jgi:DNA primase